MDKRKFFCSFHFELLSNINYNFVLPLKFCNSSCWVYRWHTLYKPGNIGNLYCESSPSS